MDKSRLKEAYYYFSKGVNIAIDLSELKKEKVSPYKQVVMVCKMKEKMDENFSKMFKILTIKESEIIAPLISKGKFHSANIIFGQWFGIVDEKGDIIKEAVETNCNLENELDEILDNSIVPMLLHKIKDLKSENESLKQKLKECGVEIESNDNLDSEEMISKSININPTAEGLRIAVDKELLRDGLVDKLLEMLDSED